MLINYQKLAKNAPKNNTIIQIPLILFFLILCATCTGLTVKSQIDKRSFEHAFEFETLNRTATLKPDPQYLKIGLNGAVSGDVEMCNKMAVENILVGIPGSNAADAAVTLALCIGMVNFFSSGIGGGGYAVYSDGQNKDRHITIDFREMAPELSHKNMFSHDPNKSKIGGLSIAVPGELAGFYKLYLERGSGVVSWERLLKPVVELGFSGWNVSKILATFLKEYEPYFKENRKDWGFVLHEVENRVLSTGEWITRPALAKTLDLIGKSGNVSLFYDRDSSLVKGMVNKIQSSEGIITETDFANYRVDLTKPLSLKVRKGWKYSPNNDLTVMTSGGSSSGAALLSALRIMDNFENLDKGELHSKQLYQLVETMKWMASARSRLGDFGGGPNLPLQVKDIMGDTWVQYAVNQIESGYINRAFVTLPNWKNYFPKYEVGKDHGTTHFSIVDKENNAVSLTTSINLSFGSLVHDPNSGIIFNNVMDDFSQPLTVNSFGLMPSPYNYPNPEKRPLSSSSPTIILNELGLPDMILGASGGSRIITAVLQTIVRTYWYNMSLLETVAYPRLHHQLFPDYVDVERFIGQGFNYTQSLHSMGHNVTIIPPKSVINAIKSFHSTWHSVSDFWRKYGVSITY